MNKKGQATKVVVGFYKDTAGKTRPITKTSVELNQRKTIMGPHKFREVGPEKSKVDVAQRLENLLERLSMLENQKQDLITQKQELEKAGKDSGAVDRQIAVQQRMILRQKVLIKKLGSTANLSQL